MQNSSAFHIITKSTGSICNLDCTYCFYLEKEKLYPGNKEWKMNELTLENYIRQYIETQKTTKLHSLGREESQHYLVLTIFVLLYNYRKNMPMEK